MTDAQKAALGECPDCSAKDLRMGPRGGAATNFACFSCSARFNGMWAEIKEGQIEVLFFERTGKIDPLARGLLFGGIPVHEMIEKHLSGS